MRIAFLSLVSLSVVCACTSGVTPVGPGGPAGNGGVGDPCDPNHLCRAGLVCGSAGTCQPGGTTDDGKPCSIGDECKNGQCLPNRTCGSAGAGAKGSPCGGDADCGKGLRCGFDGKSFFPTCLPEGGGDVGKKCTTATDCFQGLICVAGLCTDYPKDSTAPTPKGIPPYVPSPTTKPWPGATCKDPVKTAPVTALWKLPGASGKSDDDFFSIPFPNDALRVGGKVSLASFPHDPNPAMGFDAVKRYLDVLEPEPFGPYSTVFFRFDGEFDFASISLDGTDPEIRVVDLTDKVTDATFGQRRGLSVFYTNGRNKYICQNWLAIRPNDGDPYKPNGRFAVVIKQGIKAKVDGSFVKQDADLGAMLGSSAPSGSALAAAYPSYQPLRDYLAKEKIDPTLVTAATMFTVGDPTAAAKRIDLSVKAATAPAVTGWTLCKDATTKSPCPMADGDRGCGTPNPAFDELHGLIDIPIYQKGTAPYLASGGEIDVSGDPSTPIAAVRTEKVCAALTIPKGTAPASGWPLLVYAHGTGGSFRSHAIDGSAAMLSSIDLAGTKHGFAVLGIDQVGHGPRQCGGTACATPTDPSNVVFDFANPQAARFTYLQGAADLHSLVRAAATLGTVSDGGTNVTLNVSKVFFWGHSQGATEGALFLSTVSPVPGAVLSGEGGGFYQSLLTKTNPVDIKDVLWIALSESQPGDVNGYHPVISLLQTWVDPVDPIHFAALDVVPPTATSPRDVFQPSGTKDTYTPGAVQIPFASEGGFAFVDPIIDAKVTTVPFAQGNVTVGSVTGTAAIRQYTPDTYDGHFVAFKNAQAKTDLTKFLARVANGEVPKVPE